MSSLDEQLRDLALANRILAHEQVVDAFGHVSIRHPQRPDRYFLNRMRGPELVTVADILEYELDGTPVDHQGQPQLSERFIHSAIYEARPDVNAVVHHHAHDVIPFTVTPIPLRPVVHVGASMGAHVPMWDIRDKFGDTSILVTNLEQARDLAAALGPHSAALMRGHGAVVARSTLKQVVMASIYMQVNAKLLLESLRLSSTVEYLSPGEIEALHGALFKQITIERAWEYWRMRADTTGIA